MLAAVLLLLTGGCGSVTPPPPDAGLHVIAIDSESVRPPNSTCLEPVGAPECQPLILGVGTVVDDDVTETLDVRWFVDGLLSDSVLVFRPDPPSVRRSTDLRFDVLPQRLQRGSHLVKILVSDGFAQSASDLEKVAEGKTSAERTWCVDTTECQNGAGPGP